MSCTYFNWFCDNCFYAQHIMLRETHHTFMLQRTIREVIMIKIRLMAMFAACAATTGSIYILYGVA